MSARLRPIVVLAACLAALWLAVATAPAFAQDPTTGSDEASNRFRAGVAFYKSRDFPAALAEFKKAYELAPNYRVLFNLGQTSRELNDYATALASFEQYLEQGGKEVPAARVKDVKVWIEELKRKVARVKIKTNVEDAEILVDDVSVGKSPLDEPVIVNAGRRRFTASRTGYTPAQRAVDLAGAEESVVDLELTALEQPNIAPPPPEVVKPPPEKKAPIAAFALLGVTGACAVATGVLGGLAIAARGDLDTALAAFPGDPAAIDDAQRRTNTFAIGADVAGAVTIAGAVTTVVLFVVWATSGNEDAKPAKSGVRVTPTGLGFGVSF